MAQKGPIAMAAPHLSHQEDRKSKEKCGICCIPATSRGVLDCCNDVFCFSCIDTWSAFTNQCPLCKLKFKFINFVAGEEEEDVSDAETEGVLFDFLGQEREEPWSANDEDDGTLSFPSYFISEDAVVCLDGDLCLVRSGLPPDGEFGLEDTSVACDGCDCWYHASCVRYKPDSQNEKAWRCPRCMDTGALDLFKFQPSSAKFYGSKSSNELFDKNGAYTFVDEGETAVVVSMDASIFSMPSVQPSGLSSTHENEIEHIDGEHRVAPASNFPLDTTIEVVNSFSSMETSATNSVVYKEKGSTCQDSCEIVKAEESSSALSASTVCFESTPKTAITHAETYCEPQFVDVASKENSKIVCDEDLQANLVAKDMGKMNILKELEKVKVENKSDAQEILYAKKREAPKIHEERQKSEGKRQKSDHRQLKTNSKSIVSISSSKSSASKDVRILKGSLIESVSDAKQEDDESVITNKISFKEAFNPRSKVMDELKTLVQGVSPCHRRVILPRPSAKEGENGKIDATRTRKIVYRGSDLDKHASKLVDQMRKNLKEAGYTSNDLGKINVTDEKFFTAFKAAILSSQASLRRQDGGLQRTKVHKPGSKLDGSRNSLMKKLYGGTGKRRQAWDRDWDISSWRERVSQEKKVKASAKDILQKEIAQIEETILKSKKEEKAELDSLQSRIYLADTSLLPRQSDIKPLSAQLEHKQPVQQKMVPNLTKTTEPVIDHEHVIEGTMSSTNPTSNIDKRQWALNILARKSKQEKCPKRKGSLLEELPGHLRPILEYDRRSKVPTASRQTQLDRFVEHYLQEQNPKALDENPECKAAIAAAVNKEKEIYDRSNSKGVYINLCVQALSVAAKAMQLIEPANCSVSSAEEVENMVVIKAWKATGLISDSPPQSPTSGERASEPNLLDLDNSLSTVMDSSTENIKNEIGVTHKSEEDKDGEVKSTNAGLLQDIEEDYKSCSMNERSSSGNKEGSNQGDINEEAFAKDVTDINANVKVIIENTLLENDDCQVEKVHEWAGTHSDTMDSLCTPIINEPSRETRFEGTCSTSGQESLLFDENVKTDEDAFDDAFQIERISKQVETYIKEHIRPLHRSHVITTEQYRWAVAKTTNKVMQHHVQARSADFLISEGEKVKRLAEQYLALYNEQRH